MSDRDTITLPRELAEKALEALEHFKLVFGGYSEEVKALRTALAAPRLEVTVDPRLTAEEAAAISAALAAEQPKQEPVAYFDLQKQVFYWARPTMIDVPMTVALEPLPLYAAPPAAHPGYVIGSHWLETAYSRICAGEAEADVLRDIGLVREEAFLTGVAHLKAENEALRRDAERYRWMATGDTRRRVCNILPLFNAYAYRKEHIDAAIDAAMGDKR